MEKAELSALKMEAETLHKKFDELSREATAAVWGTSGRYSSTPTPTQSASQCGAAEAIENLRAANEELQAALAKIRSGECNEQLPPTES